MALPRVVLCIRFLSMEFLLGGRTMVLPGMSDALAAARCAGEDEMVRPRVVLCIRLWTMEFLLSGRTMVLPGMSACCLHGIGVYTFRRRFLGTPCWCLSRHSAQIQ